jgi:preprotein translocase subunit YajC
MHRRKSIDSLLAVFALLLGAAGVFAHGDLEHVLGTVTAVTENAVTVETVKHTQVTVLLDPSTKFLNSNATAALQNLKMGDRVVIHAKKNADKKLVAVEVKWGATAMSTGQREDMDHKH